MKYWAFISYAHSDNRQENRLWADWLQDRLEGFVVPKELVGTEGRFGKIPERIYPVFQDDKELPTSADLGTAINEALEESRVLVVLCSPNSARSHWVNEEIITFKHLGREGNIIAAILWGEPNASVGKEGFSTNDECFPEGLRYQVTKDRKVDLERPAEPIAADLRDPETGAQSYLSERGMKEHFDRAFLRITAGVLGVGFETLAKRNVERERREAKQRRRRKVLLLALTVLTLVGGLVGGVSYFESVRERQVSLERRFESALAQSAEARVRGNFKAGWKDLQEARSAGAELGDRERDLAMEAHSYLTSTRYPVFTLKENVSGEDSLVGISLHERSNTGVFVGMPSGKLVEVDLATREEIREIPVVDGPEDWKATFRLCHGPPDGPPKTIVVAGGESNDVLFLDYETGKVTARHELKGSVSSVRPNWKADLVAVTSAETDFLHLYRLSDGSEVTVIGEKGDDRLEGWDAAWLSKERLAVACNDGTCRIVTTEGKTHQTLREGRDLGSFLAVCATSDRVVVGTGYGELLFWDRFTWDYKGSISMPKSESVMRIVSHHGSGGVESSEHIAVMSLQGTLSWIDPEGLRILDSFSIGGSPRMDLVLNSQGLLYAMGVVSDVWVHSSAPQVRWALPSAGVTNLDGWEVHPGTRSLIGGAGLNTLMRVVNYGVGAGGELDGFETNIRGIGTDALSVHVDPARPQRLLMVCEESLQEVDLSAGRTVKSRSLPELSEEVPVRGAGYLPDGGVYAVLSDGGVLLWPVGEEDVVLKKSGWEKIRGVLPFADPGKVAVWGGKEQLAVLEWGEGNEPVLKAFKFDEGQGLIGLAIGDERPWAVLSSGQLDRVTLMAMEEGGSFGESVELPVTPESVRVGKNSRVLALAISERSGLVARGGEQSMQIYDLGTGRLLHELGGLGGSVTKLAFFGPRDALVYDVSRLEIGENVVGQKIWDWSLGGLLLEEEIPELEDLQDLLPKTVLPRYFLGRGACAQAVVAAAANDESQWPDLLPPRVAARFGVDAALAEQKAGNDDDEVVRYVRSQAAVMHEQFVRGARPTEESRSSDIWASYVSRTVLEEMQDQYENLPEGVEEVLEILKEREAIERSEPDIPLERALLLARKPEPDGEGAVRSLELAFNRLSKGHSMGLGGMVSGECRQLVTAARLFVDWEEGSEARTMLLEHVGKNMDRYLEQYWDFREAVYGDDVPDKLGGVTFDSVESMGRYTIDYSLAFGHRDSTLRLCRDLFMACDPGDSERVAQLLAGFALESFCALSEAEQGQVGEEEYGILMVKAREVFASSPVLSEPFEFALRTALVRAQRLILLDRFEEAGELLGSLTEPAKKGLAELPENTDLPLLVAGVSRVKLDLAAKLGETGKTLRIVETGVGLLTPPDEERNASTGFRHEEAGRLAKEVANNLQEPGWREILYRRSAESYRSALKGGEAALLDAKQRKEELEAKSASGYISREALSATNTFQKLRKRYRSQVESYVNAAQNHGSVLLQAEDVEGAMRSYRSANDVLMDVLKTDIFEDAQRRDLAWHRIWTLQRIAEIEQEQRPDSAGAELSLLTWEKAVLEEAVAVERPAQRIIFSFAEAADLLAASSNPKLAESAVKAYRALVKIASDLRYEAVDQEQIRQRIIIVAHYNRAYLCREQRIRGVDIVGEFEAALEQLKAYNGNPEAGSWEHDMQVKVLTELEREYRGDGEIDRADEAKGLLEELQGEETGPEEP